MNTKQNGMDKIAKLEPVKLQAEALIQEARKNKIRSWSTGWKKPKLIKAGKLYQEAAYLFCQARETGQAKEALIKSFECFDTKKQWYQAAKVQEEIIKLEIETEKCLSVDKIAMAKNAAANYAKASQTDNAAYILEKVGNVLMKNGNQNQECKNMLDYAAKIVQLENRPIQAAFYVTKLLHMDLELKDFNNARKNAEWLVQLYQEANHKASFGRSVLTLLLILILTNQIKEAERVVRIYASNCLMEQQDVLTDLIFTYNEADIPSFKQICSNSQVFLSLREEYKTVCQEIDNMIQQKAPKSQENLKITTPSQEILHRKRSNTISGIESVTTLDNVKNLRPINLVPKNLSKTYFDVTGYDIIDPRYGNAMTADQWREFKRQDNFQSDDE